MELLLHAGERSGRAELASLPTHRPPSRARQFRLLVRVAEAATMRRAVVLFGVLNAAAYSLLLPLWEGFDETYHYGYVQYLSTHRSFPVLGRTWLSQEEWHAVQLSPVSHYIQPFTRAPMN